MFEGRSDEQKRKLVTLITQSVVEALDVRRDGVVGGVFYTDADSAS